MPLLETLQLITVGNKAQKYKNYQKCRDILAGKALPTKQQQQQQQQQSNSRKRGPEPPAPPSQTPSKRPKRAIETPSHHHFHDEHLEETPTISRKLFSPTAVTSLGPTPQRDGRVLGLFDLLQEEGEEGEQGGPVDSPSKKHQTSRHSTGEARSKVHATPSKRPSSMTDMAITPRMGRTPMSASKRQYLNTFISPLKSRDTNTLGPNTPSSRQLHLDETPQFLKRYSGGLPGMVDENGEFDVPAPPLRLPRKPLGRGLSEIVASLRKVEEEQADEDLEALREMEAEEAAVAGGAPVTRQPLSRPAADEEVLVPDTQNQRLPLGGFDDEGMYDSPVEEGQGADGNPMRVFKKKGQKRTTRKVNMKPVWIKRPAETATQKGDADGEDDDDDDEVVQKTQLGGDGDEPPANVSSDSEFDDGKTAAAKKPKTAKKKESKSKAGKEPKEGTVKKAARKVNELAHANFQRLKLRQNGAKGGPGYNSRFRRRR